MNHPEGDPEKWTAQERKEFLADKAFDVKDIRDGWGFYHDGFFFSGLVDPENGLATIQRVCFRNKREEESKWYSDLPDPEKDAWDCIALRKKLLDKGYSWTLEGKGDDDDIEAEVMFEPKKTAGWSGRVGIDKSENKAFVVAACRSIIARERDNAAP